MFEHQHYLQILEKKVHFSLLGFNINTCSRIHSMWDNSPPLEQNKTKPEKQRVPHRPCINECTKRIENKYDFNHKYIVKDWRKRIFFFFYRPFSSHITIIHDISLSTLTTLTWPGLTWRYFDQIIYLQHLGIDSSKPSTWRVKAEMKIELSHSQLFLCPDPQRSHRSNRWCLSALPSGYVTWESPPPWTQWSSQVKLATRTLGNQQERPG